MKKLSSLLIVVAVLAILYFMFKGTYNGMVTSRNEVEAQWANVQNQYQRRADLIPNLVNTVKGYATHESSTLENVVNARAKATQITVDPTNLTPEKLKEFQAAQGELSSALGKLIALQENYPDLKANENFLALQNQLEETENRISVERTRFNDVAKTYKNKIEKFPGNIFANIFGFKVIPLFEAQTGAEKAPTVSFDK